MNDRAHIRLLVLQALETSPQYTANQETLIKALKGQGFAVSRDQLHIELAWLENNADAIVDQVSGGVHIATLTLTGQEAAQGVVVVPGIARPFPGRAG